MKSSEKFLAFLCLLLCTAGVGSAQTTQGKIVSPARAASDAAVPGVGVTVTNLATDLVCAGATADNGTFRIPTLPAGAYKLAADKTGFANLVVQPVIGPEAELLWTVMSKRNKQRILAAVPVLLSASGAAASPQVEQLAPHLYAYVSDNDHSSNSTFLVGQHGILVVDTGLNSVEGHKLLEGIRKISPLPVRFIINTHYHPDHQGGNGVVGPEAVVISSPFTRDRTLQRITQLQEGQEKSPDGPSWAPQPAFRPAAATVGDRLTVYVDDNPVEIISPGPAHTMGDLYVYFPNQRTVATGDLYLTNSSPAMDQGSAANWIAALGAILALPVDHFVPGHFEIGTRATIARFRDYLAHLERQVEKLSRSGASVERVRQEIDAKKYSGFRQYPQFHATFADNAETIYRQLQHPR